MPTVEVTLCGGVWREGTQRRRGRVSWPDEVGEWTLVEDSRGLLPAERVTHLIARCAEVDGLGGEKVARQLTAGDRTGLVLELRRLAIGDVIRCVLSCPSEECATPLELELLVGDLLVDGALTAGPTHEVDVEGQRVVFRLPTGLDEERAAERALEDPAAAVDELLEACLVDALDRRSATFVDRIGDAMAAVDPQADLRLELTCPECGEEWVVPFDAAAFFFAELSQRAGALERDVHVLARHYGWTEDAVLALPPARRARYLALIDAEAAAR